MVNFFRWPDIELGSYVLRSKQLPCEEYCFMHIPEALQPLWLQHTFFPIQQQSNAVTLQIGDTNYGVHQTTFWQHLKIVMRRSSLLANLSLYDNLLLPALYHDYSVSDEKIQDVITQLDLHESIHQQAAERSDDLHAYIALGQCLLYPPKMIVIQDVCTSLSVDNQECFYDLLQMVLKQTGAGLCYVSSSQNVGLPIHFPHDLMLEQL